MLRRCPNICDTTIVMGIKKRLQQAGPSTRSRVMQKKYLEYLDSTKKADCVFCAIPEEEPGSIIKENEHTFVVKNRFGYTVWDGCEVLEHLMIIPKVHRDVLESFTKKESDEWVRVCAEYERKGYSLYTRSLDNITRSILHHHTHFIRLGNRRKKYIIYLRKPHILMTK